MARLTRNVINKRDLFSYDGKTQTLIDWSEELGIKLPTLRTRIHRRMAPEKVFCNRRAFPGQVNLVPIGRIDDGIRQWKFMTMFHFLYGIARKKDRQKVFVQVANDYAELRERNKDKPEVKKPEYQFDFEYSFI